ncbi:hypothetical protein BWI15_28950 [Kribbella sp. ALI-6-A]|uniref:hypothetical protein n=1 Tax=Kribbella sp. ALI-6-A TaxID=1933817 RepID=UPI00097BC41B|nr:hypothetical protein [Kribbella sp. ALI-6-A]ONI67192.1 hypothetical protein BWI15_28950 [Kribbella sp. ALI-6-A]
MSGIRRLAAALLIAGLVTACSDEFAGPTPPSPGHLAAGSDSERVQPPTIQGTGLTAAGIRLTAVPRGDGSFDVTEEVVLRSATRTLRLRVPQSGERLQGMLARTDPEATGLRIVADGSPVLGADTEVKPSRTLSLEPAATRLELTYRLSGSSARSVPSRVGRALAAISPLTAATDGTLPTHLAVSGGGLLNAACPLMAETRCAVGQPPRLGIQPGLPAARALAVLQLDLPMQP